MGWSWASFLLLIVADWTNFLIIFHLFCLVVYRYLSKSVIHLHPFHKPLSPLLQRGHKSRHGGRLANRQDKLDGQVRWGKLWWGLYSDAGFVSFHSIRLIYLNDCVIMKASTLWKRQSQSDGRQSRFPYGIWEVRHLISFLHPCINLLFQANANSSTCFRSSVTTLLRSCSCSTCPASRRWILSRSGIDRREGLIRWIIASYVEVTLMFMRLVQTAIPFLVGTKFDTFSTFPRDEQEEITKQVSALIHHALSWTSMLTQSPGETLRQSNARLAHLLFNIRIHQRAEDIQDRSRKGNHTIISSLFHSLIKPSLHRLSIWNASFRK